MAPSKPEGSTVAHYLHNCKFCNSIRLREMELEYHLLQKRLDRQRERPERSGHVHHDRRISQATIENSNRRVFVIVCILHYQNMNLKFTELSTQ